MQRRTLSGLGAVMLPPPRWPPQLRAPPSELGVDAGAAPRRGLEALEVQDARARAGDEAAGAGAHRARRLLGLVVEAAREHAHRVEPGPAVVAVALAAAAQHALGETLPDPGGALDDRLGPGAARAAVRGDLVAEGEEAAHPRGDPAAHHLLDDRGAEPADLAGVRHRHQALAHGVEAAHPGADHRPRLPVHVVVRAGRGAGSRRPSTRRRRRSRRSGGWRSSP